MIFRVLALLFSVFFCFQVSAESDVPTSPDEDGWFYLRGTADFSKLEVKPEYYVGGDSDLEGKSYLGLTIGYQFNNGIRFDVGKSVELPSLDFSGGEAYRLDESVLTVSYRFPLSEFYFFPGIGYSRYSLEILEGDFFRSLETQHEIDSSQSFLILGFEFPLSDKVGVTFLYRDMDTEFGNISGFSGGFYVAF